jgi:hypothetical protein
VEIRSCGAGNTQQWRVHSDGTVVNVASGTCLDAKNAGTADSTPLEIWTCSGNGNQKWGRG